MISKSDLESDRRVRKRIYRQAILPTKRFPVLSANMAVYAPSVATDSIEQVEVSHYKARYF